MPANIQGQSKAPVSTELEHELDIPSSMVLRGSASLKQLRDRVQAVVKELNDLREQNRKLAKKILALESPGSQNSKTTNLTFDEDKEQLLKKVNSFIETIDSHLNINEKMDE